MKAILNILFFLTALTSSSQGFKDDWKEFIVDKNWEIIYSESPDVYLEYKTVGAISFVSKNNPNLKIKYYVFDISKLNQDFYKILQSWYFKESCLTVSNGERDFTNFSIKKLLLCYSSMP